MFRYELLLFLHGIIFLIKKELKDGKSREK